MSGCCNINNSSSSKFDEERGRIVQLFASLLGASSDPIALHHPITPRINNTDVTRSSSTASFGLGGSTSRVCSNTVNKSSFLELLANETTTLCTVPSFDICSENDDFFRYQGSTKSSMPPPAAVIPKQQQQQHGEQLPSAVFIPEMKASVFASILPPGFEIPLSTKPSSSLELSSAEAAAIANTTTTTNCNNDACYEIDSATVERGAFNMAEPISWTRSSASQIPMALVRSLSSSFSSLIDQQMKACSLRLLKQSITSTSPHARSRLLTLLSPTSSIGVLSITTSFDTTIDTEPNLSSTPEEQHPQDSLLFVLPLLFQASVTVMVGPQTQRSITLRTKGQIKGSFRNSTSYLLNGVEVTLDTKSLLTAMVEEARHVVAQVVAAASAPPAPSPSNLQVFSNTSATSTFSTSTSLSSLLRKPLSNSAPATIDSVTTSTNNSMPAKISLQSFASMKLIDKLRNSNGSSRKVNNNNKRNQRASSEALTLEKNPIPTVRSVTWNPSVKDTPDHNKVNTNKRRKILELQPQLLSSKSFGKPHASLFESNRNATFAEFGRAEQTCATYLASQPATVSHSQSNRLFHISTTTTSTSTMQRNFSSTSFSGPQVKKNDLLASFAAASQPKPSHQLPTSSLSNSCMDLSDLRGFLGDALGAPSFVQPKQQSPSSQTTTTTEGQP